MSFRVINNLVLIFLLLICTSSFSCADTVIFGPGKTPLEDDASYNISFKNPVGFDEDEISAQNNGLIKLYIPKGKKIDESFMIITIAFKKKTTSRFKNIDYFIKDDIDNYKKLYKNAKVDIASLPKDVTIAIENDRLPFKTLLFKCKSDKSIADAIVLFFETPDGFWSISYTAPGNIIFKTKDVFLLFIKGMEIVKK